MLRIRLSRVGKKKQPSYRIVVADSRAPRDGQFVEIIGHYNPLTDPATITVKEERAILWLQRGAQPSETAAKLLNRLGILEKAGRAHLLPPIPTVRPKPRAEAPAASSESEPTPHGKAATAEPESPAQPEEAPVAPEGEAETETTE